MNILDAIADRRVFAQHFRRPETWQRWFAFLAALFGLSMTPERLEIYRQHTGRNTPPAAPLQEAWLVIGRRGGKSFVLAVVAVFLACFKDWRPFLGPGEVGTVMIVAADRKQARVIMRYCLGLLEAVPMLKRQIEEGDHYAGSWPVEQFRKFGILYEPAARPKSELYVDLLPLINSRRIELLDDARLVNQH